MECRQSRCKFSVLKTWWGHGKKIKSQLGKVLPLAKPGKIGTKKLMILMDYKPWIKYKSIGPCWYK
jgi:hypothetical protein